MDVGSKLTKERMREAIAEAEFAFLDAGGDCAALELAAWEHLGPYSQLSIIRRMLAKSLDAKV